MSSSQLASAVMADSMAAKQGEPWRTTTRLQAPRPVIAEANSPNSNTAWTQSDSWKLGLDGTCSDAKDSYRKTRKLSASEAIMPARVTHRSLLISSVLAVAALSLPGAA